MLTPDQLEIKKRQRILKSAQQGRVRAQALQREKRQKVSKVRVDNAYTNSNVQVRKYMFMCTKVASDGEIFNTVEMEL